MESCAQKSVSCAENSALQNMAGNEDFRPRLAGDLRQADVAYEGPLWRAADTSGWYAAVGRHPHHDLLALVQQRITSRKAGAA